MKIYYCELDSIAILNKDINSYLDDEILSGDKSRMEITANTARVHIATRWKLYATAQSIVF